MGNEDFGDDYGDDYGDEGGGADRRIARLLRRRQKLEHLLPLARNPRQAERITNRIHHIDSILDRTGYTQDQAAIADARSAAGVEGIGALKFQAEAPPGLGRLVRLPFYPFDGNGGTVAGTTSSITEGGFGQPSETNPVVIEFTTGVNTTVGPHGLQTPQISWATLRLVGFETVQKRQKGTSESGPIMLVSDLQIGGGANLFTHEDFADAMIYDANQPEFCGLRDYPIIKSPNTATVTMQMVAYTATFRDSFTCSLLAEVLVDDNYGAHIPGPYARKGAIVRQGGSFV